MTLTTHTVIAAAITKPFMRVHPVLGFFVALASHYLSDAVPHWDYGMRSLSDKENFEKRKIQYKSSSFLTDAPRIALDGFLGLALALVIMHPHTLRDLTGVYLAALGGVLPDFLQGIYYSKRAELLLPLQRFHDFFHSKIKLGPYPLIGVPFQLVILFFFAYFLH